jgi:putative zinc finger/helix-turn-helix YgiT family protein
MQTPGEKPFPWKCGYCREKAVRRVTLPYSIEMQHDGRMYTVTIPDLEVPRCENCGELVLDSPATKRIEAEFREQLDLLKPEEIRRYREALHLTQRELAEHLCIAEATLSRWETGGQIQQRGYNKLLRHVFGLEDIRAAVAGQNGVSNGDPVGRVMARLVRSIEAVTVREAVEGLLTARPELAAELETGNLELEPLLGRMLVWVLALGRSSRRGWIQFFKGEPPVEGEGRWLVLPSEIRDKADGEFAAAVTQFIRRVEELPPAKRKSALRGYGNLVDALLE